MQGLLAAGLLVVCAVASASESQVPLRVAGSLFTEYQSNVTASNDEPRSGMVYRSRLEASGQQQGEQYTWALDGAFNYQEYQHQLLDGQFDAEAVGNFRWLLQPEMLDWNVDYVESVQVVDPAAPNIDSNSETVRLLGTGPTARLRLGDLNALVLSGRRQRIVSGDERYFRNTGSANLTRQPRQRLQVFARVDYSATEYSGNFPDYRTRQAVAGFSYRGMRSGLSLEAGKGWLKEQGFDPEQSDVGRFRANWMVSADRQLVVTANQEFSDEASDLESLANGTLVAGIEGTGAYRQRSAALTYSGSRAVLDPLVSVWGKQRRYLDRGVTRRDSDERGTRLVTRLYEADTGFVSCALSSTRREFLDDGRVDRDSEATVTATRLLNTRTELTAGTGWLGRSSTQEQAEYTNTSVWLALRVQLR